MNKLIGKYYQENHVNLLYGESGVGKTLCTINNLNDEGIIPILLDYDDNNSPKENQCQYTHILGYNIMKTNDISIPTGKVIIVDTYVKYMEYGGTHEFLKKLSDNNNTVIVIAHNKNIATKRDIPDVDEKWSNHLGAKIWMERTKKEVLVHVLKSRGYKGDKSNLAYELKTK